jgi:hypothetical protein
MGDRYLPLVGKRVPAARAGRYRPGMRRSIATVSLSGTLNEKLTAVANAGFDGVEIFDQDLLCSLWTPRRIRERCEELGLKIEMLQPFRDLEGMTEAQHARAMRRFEGKLDIMAELGTDLILVCSSCQPDAIDDDELSAEQLHKAAELAPPARHADRVRGPGLVNPRLGLPPRVEDRADGRPPGAGYLPGHLPCAFASARPMGYP